MDTEISINTINIRKYYSRDSDTISIHDDYYQNGVIIPVRFDEVYRKALGLSYNEAYICCTYINDKEEFLGYILITNTKDYININRIFVCEKYRRKKIATFMIRFIINKYAPINSTRIRSIVSVDNIITQNLFKFNNFKAVKVANPLINNNLSYECCGNYYFEYPVCSLKPFTLLEHPEITL